MRAVSRSRRVAVVGAGPLVLAVLLATGCQSRAGAAAIVGGQKITDDRLQALVAESLAAPGVRDALPNTSYKGDLVQYRRTVLYREVTRVLAEKAAQRLNIPISDSEVAARFTFYETSLGGPTRFPAELASKAAYSPALFRETVVRTEVALSEIGYRVGNVQRPTDAELRRLYPAFAAQSARATLSLIQVPDAATAEAVLTGLRQRPDSFDATAKQYASPGGPSAQPQEFPVTDLPGEVATKAAAAKPGDFFSFVSSANGTTVAYVIRFGGLQRPSFEESRVQMLSDSFSKALNAGNGYIRGLANELGVQVNPRYGSWDAKEMTIKDFINPVIKTTPPPPVAQPGSPADPNAPQPPADPNAPPPTDGGG